MAISFPASPTVGQLFTVGTISWTWNGSSWDSVSNIVASGSLTANGTVYGSELTSNLSNNDEGGQLNLKVPQTNTSLQNYVTVDVYQNKLRIFEGSSNAKGLYIDLNDCPNGVGGEISYKASNYVNAGTFVQIDNIKATVTTSGNRGLSLGAVTGSFQAHISGTFGYINGVGGAATSSAGTYTTTASASLFSWSFPNQGDGSTYLINDVTNNRFYRITLMIGPGYTNNFICIERL